jgi:UDP-N-acetylmuramyl pentapeptide phosphotransferase/UDP-N-acetylglucosamine-1-phosphate transferase
LLVLFLAIAFIAWVTGPAPAPAAVRRGANQALDYVRHRSDRAGLRTGGFGVTLWQYRSAIRIGVLAVALLVYIMAAHPTGNFTIVILVIAAVVLLVVELIARPPATDAADAADAAATG